MRYKLYLYWPIEIIVKDKVLTHLLKDLKEKNYNLFLKEKIYQKREEGKEDKGINMVLYLFLSLRAGGILQILQSDWFRERAVFHDLAR